MTKRKWLVAATVILLFSGVGAYSYHRWTGASDSGRAELLEMMPEGASAVLYADVATFRHSTFTTELLKWAPRMQADAEYAEFVRESGFDYERDLDRIAVAVMKHAPDGALLAVADGKFNQKKIEDYALKYGVGENRTGRKIFAIPVSGSARKISFVFLRRDRIALTDGDADLSSVDKQNRSIDGDEWRIRFDRLAGSPLFAVIRQDAAAGSALDLRPPGGLQSPQLSALLDQMQWISLAGKPYDDRLRVVAEGECTTESKTRQLTDLLNGVLVLAQAGLNGPQTRQQLDPKAREAYLEILKGASVSYIDRGESKSVRLIFDVTPKFLETARIPAPAAQRTSVPEASGQDKAPVAKPKAAKATAHK